MARVDRYKRSRRSGGAPPRRVIPPGHAANTTYAQPKRAGGYTGDLTGIERAWLLYGDYLKLHKGEDAIFPPWYENKFEVPPAHKFNAWERSILRGEKFLITHARFEKVCSILEQSRGPPFVAEEIIAYHSSAKFITDTFDIQLLREGGELTSDESESDVETEGGDVSEQEVENSELSDPAWSVPEK